MRYFPLPPRQIAVAVEIHPLLGTTDETVAATATAIEGALVSQGHYTDNVMIAALATVRVECGSKFAPVREMGGSSYLLNHYWDNDHVRRMLGNTEQGDAVKYCGRGFIQLTGRANYEHYGRHLGIDLLGSPDLALDPVNAAHIFADYFAQRHVWEAATVKDWDKVRKLVNGGENGLALFLAVVQNLSQAVANVSINTPGTDKVQDC